MVSTKQESNKALVLKAFDTLFNQRDYQAAERNLERTMTAVTSKRKNHIT